MRQALEMALEALTDGDYWEKQEAITAIKEALAQPEQEPVSWESILGAVARGWCYEENAKKTMDSELAVAIAKEVQCLYTTPPQPVVNQSLTTEPVAWLITDEKINSLQVDSIQRLIDRARHAHMTDIKLRINGQDEWFQADWLKHLIRTTPPQRKPLTDEQITALDEWLFDQPLWRVVMLVRAIEAAHGIKE